MSKFSVGEIRPSQLLWTYGPGALVDLPNLSVITMGLDSWEPNRCELIEESRLLAAVRIILGPQVSRLRLPPIIQEEYVDPLSAEAKIGVPVKLFPRWLRCVKCGLLGEYDSGLFEIKPDPFYPERSHLIHQNCIHGNHSDAVPARFLLACRNGHLDDFPWHWFVHQGPSDCRGTLRFFEKGASLQTENLWVKCDTCNAARSLVHAFGAQAQQNLPGCRGRHVHLDLFQQECQEAPRAVLLGATNTWFPISLSVLAIPNLGSPLKKIIEDGWEYLGDVESKELLKERIKMITRLGKLEGIEKYKTEEIWEAIQEKMKDEKKFSTIVESDIKIPEWEIFTSVNPPTDWPHFLCRKVDVPEFFKSAISNVLLVERLREVNALIGYTRVEAFEETLSEEEQPHWAPLVKGKPEWVPAVEVHGEGIFIRFKESVVREWEKLESVKQRDLKLVAGHLGWRNARRLDPTKGYPGIRYSMLHTLAHLLIRELALECGYNAASIRERIYSGSDDQAPMAGILLYTAAADSDGTLGGLVELGKPENLERIIEQALKRATICSSDPLCSEHNPGEDRSLHSASCHACTFVSETSCERGNRYLDRTLLVETFECKDAAFFKSFEGGNG